MVGCDVRNSVASLGGAHVMLGTLSATTRSALATKEMQKPRRQSLLGSCNAAEASIRFNVYCTSDIHEAAIPAPGLHGVTRERPFVARFL